MRLQEKITNIILTNCAAVDSKLLFFYFSFLFLSYSAILRLLWCHFQDILEMYDCGICKPVQALFSVESIKWTLISLKVEAMKWSKDKNFPVEFSLIMLHHSWLMICLWCSRLWHWWVIRWAGPAGGGRRTSKLRDRDLVQRRPHYNHEALMRGSKLMMMTIKMTIKMTILMIRMIHLVIELHQKSCQYCGFSLRDSNRDNVLLRFKW